MSATKRTPSGLAIDPKRVSPKRGTLTYYADSATIVDDSRVVVLANLYGDDADKLGPVMAAAPELLAALHGLLACASDRSLNQWEAINAARAAIAKASQE